MKYNLGIICSCVKIINNKKIRDFKNSLSCDGTKNLYIVSDFDSTLIRPYIDGKYIPSLMGLLRDRDLLPEEWRKKSSELYNYYINKAEKNKDLPLKERMVLLDEWWSKVYEVLAEYGLKYEHVTNISHDLRLDYAKGVKDFLKWTSTNEVPLIIISASGLGSDCIYEFIKARGDLTKNIKVISNELIWDNNRHFVSAKTPYVHSLNKKGELIRKNSIYEKIEGRRLALLFGDDLGDATMLDGIDVDVLKVFINVEKEEISTEVKECFDVVFDLDDSFMDLLNLLNLTYENKR